MLKRESSRDKDEAGYATLVRTHSSGWTGAKDAKDAKKGSKLVRKASKAEKASAAKKELADLPPKYSIGQIKMQVRVGGVEGSRACAGLDAPPTHPCSRPGGAGRAVAAHHEVRLWRCRQEGRACLHVF